MKDKNGNILKEGSYTIINGECVPEFPVIGKLIRLNIYEDEWDSKCPKCGSLNCKAFVCGSFGSNVGIECNDCKYSWWELE